jgi:hypothetical protein
LPLGPKPTSYWCNKRGNCSAPVMQQSLQPMPPPFVMNLMMYHPELYRSKMAGVEYLRWLHSTKNKISEDGMHNGVNEACTRISLTIDASLQTTNKAKGRVGAAKPATVWN